MKGKVLGYDAATGSGVINGDDGNRYKFSISDNKSPAPPKPGDEVDYVADAGTAKEIFVIAAAPPPPPPPGASIDMGNIANDPTVKNILAKPNVIWAGIIILGSLMGGYLQAIGALGQMGGFYGLGIAGLIHALLFAIPVLAGVLIFFELTNNKLTQVFRLVAAGAAIGGPILIPFLAGLMSPGYALIYQIASAVGVGIVGMMVTIAGGALILLTHFGVIKKLG